VEGIRKTAQKMEHSCSFGGTALKGKKLSNLGLNCQHLIDKIAKKKAGTPDNLTHVLYCHDVRSM
jgi:hypothetical protein